MARYEFFETDLPGGTARHLEVLNEIYKGEYRIFKIIRCEYELFQAILEKI
jgi:hypothetical protein